VQRSADGINFKDLGLVNARGIGSNQYRFTDAGAMKKPNISKWFYRVRYVDWDGKSALSRTASVALNKAVASILITPNPVTNDLKFIIQSTAVAPAIVSVKSVEGKTMLQRVITLQPGRNNISENTGSLANGVYILSITVNGSSSSETFMIQR
jgi:hypothetical protein